VRPLRKRAPRAEPPGEAEATRKAAPKRAAAKPSSPATPLPQQKKAPPSVAPLDRKSRQKIARGRHSIDARLDLHGHTQAEAHDVLLRFLRVTQAKGGRVALVITGKGGRGEHDRGVLKRAVPMWLGLPEFREIVIGFDSAAIGHGGEGALYVRLRKARV
jgi:DNA-nicking Smr family endonuclease